MKGNFDENKTGNRSEVQIFRVNFLQNEPQSLPPPSKNIKTLICFYVIVAIMINIGVHLCHVRGKELYE